MKTQTVILSAAIVACLAGCGSEKKVEQTNLPPQQVVMVPTSEFQKGSSSNSNQTPPAAPTPTTPSASAFDQSQPGDR